MTANISLGQYLPGNSVVHRLDPRTKIFLMAIYIAVVFVVKTLPVFILPVVLLIAIFALSVVLGAQLLKAFGIPDPGSSSFLAVGLVAVIALLFLIDVLDHWSSLIIVPVLSIGSFMGSVWVTETFVESDGV